MVPTTQVQKTRLTDPLRKADAHSFTHACIGCRGVEAERSDVVPDVPQQVSFPDGFKLKCTSTARFPGLVLQLDYIQSLSFSPVKAFSDEDRLHFPFFA